MSRTDLFFISRIHEDSLLSNDLEHSNTENVLQFLDQPSTSTFYRNELSEENEITSIDESKVLFSNSNKQFSASTSLDPSSADIYKTSKTRRTEWRGSKIIRSNPSSDSAFGSMTEGDLSQASSFKLSSFQSVSSPIDEGMEVFYVKKHANNLEFIDTLGLSIVHDNLSKSFKDLTLDSTLTRNIKESSFLLNPPKLIVSDDNCQDSIRKFSTTEIPPLSLKIIKVSSLEDLNFKNTYKKFSRSLEEEKRIDLAFKPICTSIKICEANSMNTNEKKLTAKERSVMWKNALLKCNKHIFFANSQMKGEIEESNDEDDEISTDNSSSFKISEYLTSSRRSLDRPLFNLIKLKQNAIAESLNIDNSSDINSSSSFNHSISISSNDDNTTITSTTNDECSDDDSFSESLLKTPSIEEVRQFVDVLDDSTSGSASNSEAVPLLGIEMQSLHSSTEAKSIQGF